MRRWPWLPVSLLAAACATAPPAPRDPTGEENLREILGFLAADERLGRDTPSEGLDQAAAFLAARFAKAGLAPGGDDGTFLRRYAIEGFELDSLGTRVTVRAGEQAIPLKPLDDVRLWRAGAAFDHDDIEVLRLDPALATRAELRPRGRAPVLLEVEESSALWQACAAPRRRALRGFGAGTPPWLLVRKGLLPAGALTADVHVPAPAAVQVELHNVVGVLRGSERPDEVVLFTAHYDHVGVGLPTEGDAIYNGADDDGTGTTAVVALAEAFAQRGPLPRTLVFACVSGEERGLLGSRALAEDPPVPLANVAVNVNIEMLGRPWKPRTAWVTGRALSDFEDVVRAGLERAGLACAAFPQEAMLFMASDNWSFARKGVVAHTISASSLHADYHRPGDEVERIDFANMAAVVRGIFEVGLDLARAPGRLAYNEQGRRRLHLDEDGADGADEEKKAAGPPGPRRSRDPAK